jgi:hypothetical protein
MTQDQLRAVVTDTTELTPDQKKGKSVKGGHAHALLQAPYSSGQYSFNAVFTFDDDTGGLTKVELELVNTGRGYELEGALRSKYGSPASSRNGQFLSTVVWYPGNDQVSLLRLGDNSMVSVQYVPRTNADNKGL